MQVWSLGAKPLKLIGAAMNYLVLSQQEPALVTVDTDWPGLQGSLEARRR
jgi:hypothetical protein